jgi:FlaA1/EpsC-like NDP-sugar epimerase
MLYLFNHRRRLLVVAADVLLAVAAYLLANLFRFEGHIPARDAGFIMKALPALVLIRGAAFLGFGLYRGVWAYASISDLIAVVQAVTAGSAGFAVALTFLGVHGHSRAVLAMDWLLLIFLVGALRLALRVYRSAAPPLGVSRRPVLIIGAGDAGEMVIRELQLNGRRRYHPVGFLDDDAGKKGLRIHGVPVLGPVEEVARISREKGVAEVIIAIPSADRRLRRRIFDRCRAAGLEMRTIPDLDSLLAGTAKISDLREVRLEDLLRREPARLNRALIRASLQGSRVLVTGAGGSIGSEICRQVGACEPALLIMLDKGENPLFEIDAELAETFPRLARAATLADIRHAVELQEVFRRYHPEVVFHAAACKHVPLMESHPEEAVSTNVGGTRCLVEVAIASGTRAFVLISTDKAVNPTSVMGASKRAAERYIQSLASDHSHGDTILCAVRFGNVLGSNGSVVPTFKRQIQRGGPITITHPDMTRFFMTVQEAVQLVLRAATLATGGEVFVLDMGEPVRIADMARDVIRLSGLEPERDIEIAVTGVRPGEKFSEELWYETEEVAPTGQEKLLVVRKPATDGFLALLPQLAELEQLATGGERLGLIQALRRVVPEYQPSSAGGPEEDPDLGGRR